MSSENHEHNWKLAETKVVRNQHGKAVEISVVKYCDCGKIEETITKDETGNSFEVINS